MRRPRDLLALDAGEQLLEAVAEALSGLIERSPTVPLDRLLHVPSMYSLAAYGDLVAEGEVVAEGDLVVE